MARNELAVDTVAEAYLALLAERGIDYLFATGGTDFARSSRRSPKRRGPAPLHPSR